MPYDKIVGIDPDLNKSGVAVYDTKTGEFNYTSNKKLWELFDFMKLLKAGYFIENSNLLKGKNWHGAKARENVGKGKAVSQLIVDFAKAHQIPHLELRPNGYSKHFTNHKSFVAETGLTGSSNPETRAAAAIIIRNKHLINSNLWD